MKHTLPIRLSCLLWYLPVVSLAFVVPQSLSGNYRLSSSSSSSSSRNNNIGNSITRTSLHRNDETPSCGDAENDESHLMDDSTRRAALQTMLMAAAWIPLSASAGKPEVDSSGQLFSPKSEMLSGGSAATRGITLEERRPIKLKPGETVQTVYETRFLAYLTRFLLNFDPAAHTWWVKQGLDDSWDYQVGDEKAKARDEKFAEFAESVEVGLSNYFVGPYGSYASLEAAKAGLIAAEPVRSDRVREKNFFEKMMKGKSTQSIDRAIEEDLSKQGVLNLYTLLKARYTSRAAKRQLAILFSLISNANLQPTDEILSLLGEADNATITAIEFTKQPPVRNEPESRTSSRRGGGYSILAPPKILVSAPPALGDEYCPAQIQPIMKPTSRVLKINLLDGGQGYVQAPAVKVTQNGVTVRCEASAIMDRAGHIESIIVLDPGYGYGHGQGQKVSPPKVVIDVPKLKDEILDLTSQPFRPAKAEAELEYEIVGLDLLDGGNGFVANDFPEIVISTPTEDPDWFVQENTYKRPELRDVLSEPSLSASVREMRLSDGSLVEKSFTGNEVTDGMIARLQRDKLEMLPSQIRPELIDSLRGLRYRIPSLPLSAVVAVPSPRYRAFDPIFGPIGKVPVTKGALELSTSEYSRLALSGAVCTVIVRTVLNPLELVKTKIQLGNDKEINEFALSKVKQKETGTSMEAKAKEPKETSSSKDIKESVGTGDMITSLVELRGFGSLFQSADITFLASLVFGSFGFGATELFRRSFTVAFFSQENGQTGEEIILLAAAALACIVTAAAAAPFEVLRVKSMGLVEAKGWTDVLDLYLEDKSGSARGNAKLTPKDLLPLWGGFSPTVSRELPFAVTKFLVFDIIAKQITTLANAQLGEGAIPVQVGVGAEGLAISAFAGAFAGIAGAFISHPADLILTLTSTSKGGEQMDWKDVIRDLLSRDGGIANLFIGLPARSIFFFLVIGLQFFLYDYLKTVFQVGSDDLSLVLDVFYAVRQGLVGSTPVM